MNPSSDLRGVALFGGAFNPPHRTHRAIAAAARAQLPVHAVQVVPSGDHPHKAPADLAPAEHRLAMCHLAFAGLDDVTIDDRELRRPGPSFTVTTLAEYAAALPSRPLWFVIGADNLRSLPTWRDHHRLLALARIATFPRGDVDVNEALFAGLDLTPAEVQQLRGSMLRLPADRVAAADLRRRLARGERGLPELLPEVEAYVLAHHLYGT